MLFDQENIWSCENVIKQARSAVKILEQNIGSIPPQWQIEAPAKKLQAFKTTLSQILNEVDNPGDVQSDQWITYFSDRMFRLVAEIRRLKEFLLA